MADGPVWRTPREGKSEVSLAGLYPPYLFGTNLCIEGGSFFPIKPVSYFCPVACGCRSGDAHCPDMCPIRTPETPLCPEAQQAAIADPFAPLNTCPMSDHRNYGAKNVNTSRLGGGGMG